MMKRTFLITRTYLSIDGEGNIHSVGGYDNSFGFGFRQRRYVCSYGDTLGTEVCLLVTETMIMIMIAVGESGDELIYLIFEKYHVLVDWLD